MTLKVQLDEPSRTYKVVGFLVGLILIFALTYWVVWAGTRPWQAGLMSTSLISLAITAVIILILYAKEQRRTRVKVSNHDPDSMTFGRFMRSCILFIWECLVFGFFTFTFDGLFSFMAQPAFSEAPIETHFGIDITITLIVTITYFTLRQRAKRRAKEEEVTAWAMQLAERERVRNEAQQEKMRREEEIEHDRAAAHEAYLRNSKKEIITTEKIRNRRANEVADLERELTQLKAIPSEPEDDE